MRDAGRTDFRIEIDGGISTDTVTEAVRAGVEILVAGNAIFGKGNPRENTQLLLKMAREATLQRV
jgi:ribulose-phosphate 3-epimerase